MTTVYLEGLAAAESVVSGDPSLIIESRPSCGARASVSGNLLAHHSLALLSATSSCSTLCNGFNLVPLYDTTLGSVYPDTVNEIPGVIPFQWEYAQRVLVSEFADGSEARRLSWSAPRKNIRISYHYLTREEAQQLYDFYQKVQGPLNEFAFFFPNYQSYEKEYCGTYTGSSMTINLPSKLYQAGSYRKLYNGSTEITNYSFYYHGGPNGEDVAVLQSTPALGSKFYFSFVGNLKIRARFSEGAIQIDEIKDRFSSFSIELVGLESRFV